MRRGERAGAGRRTFEARRLVVSSLLAAAMVGGLVGAAYWTTSVAPLGGLGMIVLLVGMVLLVLPGLLYVLLGAVHLVPALRGRESFIESNPVLWILCAIFYSAVFYFASRWWSARRARRAGLAPPTAPG